MRLKFLFSTIIIPFIISSCSKYEEGPSFSFKSKDNRLVGKWIFDNEEGSDFFKIAEIIKYDFEFEKNNVLLFDYEYVFTINSQWSVNTISNTYTGEDKGDWNWENEKKRN